MDVFKIGAGAPKAPESGGVERELPAQRADRARASEPAGDQFSASQDATTVARFVEKLQDSGEAREDLIRGFRELLGRGLLDGPDAAARAADGLIDG